MTPSRRQSRIHGNHLVAQLLSAGADINIKNKDGVSAADFAPENLRSLLNEGFNDTINGNMKSSMQHILMKQVHALEDQARAMKASFESYTYDNNNNYHAANNVDFKTISSYNQIATVLQREKKLSTPLPAAFGSGGPRIGSGFTGFGAATNNIPSDDDEYEM